MVSAILTSFIGKYLCNLIFVQINQRIHNKMVESVLNTKLKFFEENTRGRILNRFSEDVTVLDNIVYTYLDLTDYSVKCALTVLIVVYTCPWVLIIALFSVFFLRRIRAINLHLTRDTYRLNSSLMSPINSLV